VEKIKGYFVVRAGFFKEREEAKKLSSRLKNLKPAVVRCIFDPKRVVKVYEEKKEEKKTAFGGEKPKRTLLTLKEVGYASDVVLKGARATFTLYFPLFEELKEGKGVFLIRLPQRLPEGARLLLKVDDAPVKSYPLEGGFLKAEVPLSKKEGKRFLKLTLDFHLYDPEDVCEAINENLYAVILKESGFELELEEGKERTIADYLLDYKPRFELLYEKPLELSKVAYYLAVLYGKHGLYNLRFGSGKKLLPSKGKARLTKEGLLLPPDFLKKKELFYLVTDEAEARFYPSVKEEGAFLFRELGFRTSTYEGWGSALFTVPFYLPAEGKGELLLRFSYGVPSAGEAWLAILLNGELFWHGELEGSSAPRELLLSLPSDFLRPGANGLTLVFTYYPREGFCKGAFPPAYFTLFEDSALLLRGWGEAPRKVRDFLSAMKGEVSLLVGDGLPKEWLLELFKNLGYFNPRIEDFKEAKDGEFLLVVDRFEKLDYGDFPLKYQKGAKIYDPATGKVLWEFDGKYAFGILQVGRVGSKKALFVGLWGEPSKEILKLLRHDYMARMEGDVVLLTERGLFNYTLPEKHRVEYPARSRLYELFERYKYLLLALALLLVSFLFYLLWRRNR